MLNLKPQVPVFILISDAARKHNLSEKVLTQFIQDGKIEAVQLPSGELLVPDNDLDKAKSKKQIIAEKFSELQGQPITISQASKKYRVPGTTIREWIPLGYIRVIDDDDYPMKLDEAEVAYCAYIYHQRKASQVGFGVPLLDEDGLAYELKHPELSQYRRKRRNHLV
jgi:hypothetical protein